MIGFQSEEDTVIKYLKERNVNENQFQFSFEHTDQRRNIPDRFYRKELCFCLCKLASRFALPCRINQSIILLAEAWEEARRTWRYFFPLTTLKYSGWLASSPARRHR